MDSSLVYSIGKYLPEPMKRLGVIPLIGFQVWRKSNFVEREYRDRIFRFGYWDRETYARAHSMTNGISRGMTYEHVNIENLNIDKGYDAIFDLGAFHGHYTVILATINPKREVFAFEPHPENVSVVASNVNLNHLENANIHSNAVSDDIATKQLFIDTSRQSSVSHTLNPTKKHNDYKPVEVDTVSISDFCARAGIRNPWLKIDIEGEELKVLRDLFSHPDIERPGGLVELHLNREGITKKKFFDILDKYDYTYTEVKKRFNELHPAYIFTSQ